MVVTGFLDNSVTYLKPYIPIDYKHKIRKVTGLQSISLNNDC